MRRVRTKLYALAIACPLLLATAMAVGQETLTPRITGAHREDVKDAVWELIINGKPEEITLDQHGRPSVRRERTQQTSRLTLAVSAPGFARQRITFRRGDKEFIELPRQLAFSLRPSQSIGGLLVDVEGQPVNGATVTVSAMGPILSDAGMRESIRVNAESDFKGRWKVDGMTDKLESVRIEFRHPKYVDASSNHSISEIDFSRLQAQGYERILERGVTIGGAVANAQGEPVAEATIFLRSRFTGRDTSCKSDKLGQFQFTNVRPGHAELTVIANGFAPAFQQCEITNKKNSPVRFTLEDGHTIRFRIQDTDGRPIQSARVVPDTWRGSRTLMWLWQQVLPESTNEDGTLVWDSAPADEVQYDIYSPNHMRIRLRALTPQEEEHVLTLHPPLEVTGRVLDAQTRKPIDSFRVIPGIVHAQGISWDTDSSESQGNGQFRFRTTMPYENGHVVRIEASGYETTETPIFQSDDGFVESDVLLPPSNSPPLAGTIVSDEGTPVADADVIVCLPGRGPYFRNGATFRRRRITSQKSNIEGGFSFASVPEVFDIVVVAEEGFAHQTQDQVLQGQPIELQPWALIAGRVMLGGHPNSNVVVKLHLEQHNERGKPHMYFDYTATSNKSGRFVFERVPPGREGFVAKQVRLWERGDMASYSYSHSVPVKTVSGEAITLTIGGQGQVVSGQLMPPIDYPETIEEWNLGFHSMSRVGGGNRGQPRPRIGSFRIEKDGSFRIQDVPAGHYEIKVQLYEPQVRNANWSRGKLIGKVERFVEVADEPVDLGEIVLQADEQGELAP